MLEPVEKTVRKSALERDAEKRRRQGLGPSQDLADASPQGNLYPIEDDVLWGWADTDIPGEDIGGSEPGVNPDLSSPSVPSAPKRSPWLVGQGGVPEDEHQDSVSPTIEFNPWWAPEPEYPMGGGYNALPKTQEQTTDTQRETGSGGSPWDFDFLPPGGGPSPGTPPESVESGGGGSETTINEGDVNINEGDTINHDNSFWSNFVDNSVVGDTITNLYEIANDNRVFNEVSNYLTENTITSHNVVNHITNHYTSGLDPNDSYWAQMGEVMGKAFDLSTLTAAVGAIPAAISTLGGSIAAALAGAVAGGYARGLAEGDTVVQVEMPGEAVAEEGRFIGYGGGNSPDMSCEQVLQEYLAAGRDPSEMPEACKRKLNI